MRCPKIKKYNDRALVEEERTHKYFLSRGYLLYGGVVGIAKQRCWTPLMAPLLVHHKHMCAYDHLFHAHKQT
jgi:hypothetical protein